MPTLFATCGLAFSGKTTLARQLAEILLVPMISLDEINEERGLHGGEGLTDTQWEETSAIAVERLRSVLDSGRSLVLDDTLSHRFLRDRYRKVAADAQADFVLLFVDTALSDITERMERNRKRPARTAIDAQVFETHKKRFEYPSEDECAVHLASTSDIAHFLASVTDNAR